MIDCRPQSMAMGNATKWLKMRVGHLPPHLSNDKAKALLCSQIDTFIVRPTTVCHLPSHSASLKPRVLFVGGAHHAGG